MTNHKDLVPGNVIEMKKDGIFDHPAIVMPGDKVYENTPEDGEHLSPLSNFLQKAGNTIQVKAYHPNDRQKHIGKVQQQLSQRRSWSILNTCQDTVTRITHGKAHSPQRNTIIGIAVVATAFYFIFRKK